MSNDKSRPIYPPDIHNYFGDFRSIAPMSDSVWENVREAEIEAAKTRSRRNYNMETSEEIAFDDLNEDIKSESEVDLDSIIDEVDMSDHGNDYGDYAKKRLY
ncbi:hypothetical protein [Clostridium sp. UBA5119]|uniref:hypothetical protein n=1 Tax=Clostridium sp. UBA5119 TaxID=1946366 RepID=UPI003218103C